MFFLIEVIFIIYKEVLSILNKNGFKAYVVGGFVRDKFLGIKGNDIDITTNALPNQITSLFKKTYPLGIKYGTILVIYKNKKFEITTFRNEEKYLDHRHPDEVNFISNLEQDLGRRDFTINALCLDINDTLIDLFNGIDDLNNEIIKCIGDPLKRFTEDPLRILRAISFSSKLGFDIDSKTQEAIINKKGLLKHLSIERILNELNKIVTGKYFLKSLEKLINLEIHKEILLLNKGLDKISKDNISFDSFLIYQIYRNINYLEPKCLNTLRLSRIKKNNYLSILRVIEKNEDNISIFDIYNLGLNNSLILNEVRQILFYKDESIQINSLYNSLPIKNINEIDINKEEIKEYTLNLNEFKTTLKKIEELIILNKLENNHDSILLYLKKESDKNGSLS